MDVDNDKFEKALAACVDRVGKTRREMETLVDAGEWLVWTAWVYKPFEDENAWNWIFRDDFPPTMPHWLDVDPHGSPIETVSRVRHHIDSGRCHTTFRRAIGSGSEAYKQAFRIRLRDDGILWVSERVFLRALGPNSYCILGVCSPADQAAIDETLRSIEQIPDPAMVGRNTALDDIDALDAEALRIRLRKLKDDIDALARSAQWLIWSATVRDINSKSGDFFWGFHDDFVQFLPEWFDVDRVEGADLSVTLNNARIPEDDDACGFTASEALRRGDDGYRQLFRVRLRDGSISWVEENVTIQSISTGVWHLVGVCIDANERKAVEAQLVAQNEELHQLRLNLEREKQALADANRRLAALASTDGLTGVKNHRAFREQLDAEIQAVTRYASPLSLVLLDIDHFKNLNDKFGHPAGDSVLVEIGRLLQVNARDCDCVARIGGEEFAVILPQTDAAGALALAERYRAIIENAPWEYVRMTASFGVASVDTVTNTAAALISRADCALYRAKAAGRNCVIAAN